MLIVATLIKDLKILEQRGVPVCVCVCVCVCLHPSTVKASYVWGWRFREQISNAVLKTFLSSAKSLYRYFIMKHQAFLTSRFILFTH